MIPALTYNDGPDVHERYTVIKAGRSKGIQGNGYYGYEANLHEIVRSSLREFGQDTDLNNIQLFKGLLRDTMKIDKHVALGHIDVDWYDPVTTYLNRIIPWLIPGGSVILDDYSDWTGCREAVGEYFNENSNQFRLEFFGGGLRITRVR